MASINQEKNGTRRIQFKAADGKRKTLRLGRVSKKLAEQCRHHVEQIVSAQLMNCLPPDETARWLGAIDDVMREKLTAVGLCEKRASFALGAFLDDYTAGRSDVKPSTLRMYGHTRRCLIAFYGADKPLRSIHAGSADEFRSFLIGTEKLSENTVRRRCGIAKQFFRAAQRRKLIDENPFSDLAATVRGNPSHYYFVTRAEADCVLTACPDAEWRLLFALSRYGGLRCPSEHLALTWEDIDWDAGKIRVSSPKTEHHEGGEFRFIPIFPELRSYLDEVYSRAEEGAKHVITRYRNANANLRTQLLRIIRRAGLKPWPKLFQNLRSTRETELCETFPLHVVTAWIGNTASIAAKHYLQVTDEHFNAALADPTQNPTQHMAATGKAARNKKSGTPENTGEFRYVPLSTLEGMGDEGLEPPTLSV